MFKRFTGRVPEFEQKVPISAFVIYKREASWLVAAFILLCFLSFLAGYFMGQRKVVRAFVQQTSEEALLEQAQPEEVSAESNEEKSEEEPATEKEKYYAPIAVNDNYGRALNLVERAHKEGVELRIKKSSRKLKNGKRKITYQIVTGPYTDKEELAHDLEILKRVPQFKRISINIRQIQEG